MWAGWTTADKTGSGYHQTINDAGLLTGPTGQQRILVVLTHSTQTTATPATRDRLIASITALATTAQ